MVDLLPLLFSHIPVKLSEDLLSNAVEVVWLEVHMSHLKPAINHQVLTESI